MIDESILLGIVAGLTVLVIGLLAGFVWLVMVTRRRGVVSASPNETASGQPPLQNAPTPAQAAANPDEPADPALPKGIDVREEGEPDGDVTRMTPFALAARDIPKLDEDDDADGDDQGSLLVSESKELLHFESDAWFGIDEPTGAKELILTVAAAKTDRGIARRRNEDAYLIDMDLQLYAVADGMGGYAGGDLASRLAVQELRAAIQSPGALSGHEDRPRRGRELIAAVERANRRVFGEAQKDSRYKGMGTTVVSARFSPRKQRVYIANVGDSRCYRMRDGALTLLTRDHTLASRGVVGPLASNICRAVGVAKEVKVDLIVDKPMPGDLYLLCSDGLPKMVTQEQIKTALSGEQDQLHWTVSNLVLAANANGGRDNITVVLVGIREIAEPARIEGESVPTSAKRVEFGPS